MTEDTDSYTSTKSEWNFDLLREYDQQISEIAQEYGLDTYPNQIEVISAEQMMDAFASVGMPLGYNHWSFGKQFMSIEKSYRRGLMGLAYEMVINSNPCISYLLEENTSTLQAIVIAHACYGHNSFFKGNYMFQNWTQADAIIDYLVFAKTYISKCEEKFGIQKVEELLDACHAIRNYGVDRYRKPPKLSIAEEKARQTKREEYLQSQVNDLWRTLPKDEKKSESPDFDRFPKDPEENILYFLEKKSPLLEPWEREIIRIVRKISQYFYPQRQTKVMNEGWATFWHYTIINTMYDRGLVTEKFMVEFLHNHTNVVFQPPFDHPGYAGINPYALGFNIFKDIRRICEDPSEEDRKWFPDIAYTDWKQSLDFAMRNFKDESFIAQYLSPKVIRDMKLFTILDDDSKHDLEVTDIHNEASYQNIRQQLSQMYNISMTEPHIQVYNVDMKGDRSLTLRHVRHNDMPLNKDDAKEVLKHIYKIWGFDTKLEQENQDGEVNMILQCPEKLEEKQEPATS